MNRLQLHQGMVARAPLHAARRMLRRRMTPKSRVTCCDPTTMVAPPEAVDREVFVISHRGTIWGFPEDEFKDDGRFPIKVVAFESKRDAEYMAERVWIHRLKAHRWPVLVKGRLWLASADDIIMHSPSPLQVDEINLKWLLEALGKSRAAVSLLSPLDPDAHEVDLTGTYMDARVGTREQVAWLNEMFKHNANPNRE